MSGKGSKSRPFSVSREKFSENWDAIFKKENPLNLDSDNTTENTTSKSSEKDTEESED